MKLIKKVELKESHTRYDLTIKDTHNFIANGTIVHNCNARFCYREDRLWCGSHRTVKKEAADSLWWKAAYQYNLAEKLAKFENHVFYGEVYGQVQKGFDYGIPKGEIGFRVFDIFNNETGKYLDWVAVEAICEELSLPMVPILYKGPWNEELLDLQNGKTVLGNHIREGFVVKPIIERYDNRLGRVILKMVGSEYLLAKK